MDERLMSDASNNTLDTQAELGRLPHAPMAMPQQALEHPHGLIARFWPVWNGWLRNTLLGN
ncbi:hypothetical protein FGG78_38860 [Thioclava sp. BHET1]|nr:hypothetical protein FGG78_38860 [Thioclava sp. BHET1]